MNGALQLLHGGELCIRNAGEHAVRDITIAIEAGNFLGNISLVLNIAAEERDVDHILLHPEAEAL